jgi:plastocyanin
MTRRFILVAAVSAALAAVVPATAAAPKLTATVGPGFTISLKKGTTRVTKLKPGTYAITVKDLSDIHNFRLKGPGVNKATSVDAVGTKVWTVKLRAGRYIFVCDPHEITMKGAFRVGS